MAGDPRPKAGKDRAAAAAAALTPTLRRRVLREMSMVCTFPTKEVERRCRIWNSKDNLPAADPCQFPMAGGAGTPITIKLTLVVCEVPPLTPVIVNE